MGAPKTARNGIEYNQIHITEDSDEEEEDEFNQNNTNDADGDDDGEQNTTLMMGADGKLTMGKKRRGRPSVELDLGQDFAANAEEEEEEEAPEESQGADVKKEETAKSGGTKKKKKRRKKRKKDGNGKNKEQDKEWAKYVFVQQLRLQQQHNDEINRVKTLWKQERQVRVEMHKKVVRQLKETKAKAEQQQVEIERLKSVAQIGQKADGQKAEQFKQQTLKLQQEKEALNAELMKQQKEFTEYRKSRIDDDKQNRQIKGDWESKERKYQQEINGLNTQIKTLKQTQITMESNLTTLKDGSNKTMEMKTAQFAEREKQWKAEKEEYEQQR